MITAVPGSVKEGPETKNSCYFRASPLVEINVEVDLAESQRTA